jgi:hypothetical protein
VVVCDFCISRFGLHRTKQVSVCPQVGMSFIIDGYKFVVLAVDYNCDSHIANCYLDFTVGVNPSKLKRLGWRVEKS